MKASKTGITRLSYQIRMNPDDLDAWREAAVAEDISIAEWIRRACNQQLHRCSSCGTTRKKSK
jgi:hypothetical protein